MLWAFSMSRVLFNVPILLFDSFYSYFKFRLYTIYRFTVWRYLSGWNTMQFYIIRKHDIKIKGGIFNIRVLFDADKLQQYKKGTENSRYIPHFCRQFYQLYKCKWYVYFYTNKNVLKSDFFICNSIYVFFMFALITPIARYSWCNKDVKIGFVLHEWHSRTNTERFLTKPTIIESAERKRGQIHAGRLAFRKCRPPVVNIIRINKYKWAVVRCTFCGFSKLQSLECFCPGPIL